MFQLTRLLRNTVCRERMQTGISVSIFPDQNAGFASKLRLCCDACGYEKQGMSSPRVQHSNKKHLAFETNPKMALSSHEMGRSYGVLQKFATALGLTRSMIKK